MVPLWPPWKKSFSGQILFEVASLPMLAFDHWLDMFLLTKYSNLLLLSIHCISAARCFGWINFHNLFCFCLFWFHRVGENAEDLRRRLRQTSSQVLLCSDAGSAATTLEESSTEASPCRSCTTSQSVNNSACLSMEPAGSDHDSVDYQLQSVSSANNYLASGSFHFCFCSFCYLCIFCCWLLKGVGSLASNMVEIGPFSSVFQLTHLSCLE